MWLEHKLCGYIIQKKSTSKCRLRAQGTYPPTAS
jgi:hypothetical protein